MGGAGGLRRAVVLGVLLVGATQGADGATGTQRVYATAHHPALHTSSCDRHCVRVRTIRYRTHGGYRRNAYVVYPAWYRPGHNPRIPLVISPHGRGVTAWSNVIRWGRLPAFGGFAVVNPEGQGRRLRLHSWGYAGQVADLARMPKIVSGALPWLRIDRGHVYAWGTSMGAQETLLLVARYPHLLAGAAAFDAVTDMARRYRDFPRVPCARRLHPPEPDRLGASHRPLRRPAPALVEPRRSHRGRPKAPVGSPAERDSPAQPACGRPS